MMAVAVGAAAVGAVVGAVAADVAVGSVGYTLTPFLTSMSSREGT